MKELQPVLFRIFIAIVLALGMILIFDYFIFANTNAKNYYKQGTDFLLKNDYQNAYYNYSKIKKTSKYYPIALYRQAWCANELGDFETAIKKYHSFSSKYHSSLFTSKAKYELARNLYLQKNYSKSAEAFIKLGKEFANTDYALAANYFLGMIVKEQSKEIFKKKQLKSVNYDVSDIDMQYDIPTLQRALNYWVHYITSCPECRYSKACVNELISVPIDLSPEVIAQVGKFFYLDKNYPEAKKCLSKSNQHKYWNYLFLSYIKLKEYDKAQSVFESHYTRYANLLNQDDLNETVNEYVNLFPKRKKNVWYKLDQTATKNQLPGRDFILYNIANLVTPKQKIELAAKIVKQYPKSKFAPELLYDTFQLLTQKKQYNQATQIGEFYIKTYPHTEFEPAVLFWLGKILQYKKDSKAEIYYKKLISEYPDDYYSFRASSLLDVSNVNPHTNSFKKLRIKNENFVPEFPFEYVEWNSTDKKWISLAIEGNDFGILNDISIDNKIIQSWIAYTDKKISTSAVYARDWLKEQKEKPSFDKTPYKLAYPLLYTYDISKNAQKLKLDEYLIIALIKEESYFNTNSVSISGARGLMQLMPATAEYITTLRHIPYATPEQLLNPQFNILVGCNYFDYLKKTLHKSNLLAVAAYNGGPGVVSKWINNKLYTDFDEFVEDIEYPETKNYVKKIYKSYWNYINIYTKNGKN